MLRQSNTKKNFSKDAISNLKSILEVIYLDVCGSLQVDSIGGNKYFVTFIDDFIRNLWTYLMKKKSDVIEVFIKFKDMVERQSSHKINTLRTDGVGGYVSRYFHALYEREGKKYIKRKASTK